MPMSQPTKASIWWHLAALLLLLGLSLVFAQVCLAQDPAPTDASANTTYVINDDPDVASIIYRFVDFGNDWQTLAPELGPIGSIHFYRWDELHTGPNKFNWNLIDVQLAKEAKLKVTLLNGQIIPKPVVLQVIPFLSNNPDRPSWTPIFYDSTPPWVYAEIEAATGVPRPVIDGRKVGYVMQDGGYTSVLPMYDNPIWQKYHWQMIAALGARYNNHPQITAVAASTGLDGETHATKDYFGGWNAIVDRDYPGVRSYFTQFVYSCMDHYRAAFPDKAVFVNNAPGGSPLRWQSALYASQIDPPIGLRHCGMWEDLQGHQGGGSFTGLWDHIRQYSMTLPIWLESPYGWGAKDTKYWSWLAGLHYHPDAIDVHREWLTDTTPDMLRWVTAHLGVTIQDTPSVWTALRDTMYPILDWGTGQSSGHLGDWTFWLTRQEIAGGGTVRVWREELPAACRTQLYSTQARRTDQANGQNYMYFNIDDGYPYVGQVPLSQPNGTVSYAVKIIFLNRGSDTLSLQYRNYAGAIVSRTLTKGPALGPVNTFVTHTFTLEDAYFNNNLGDGTSDFRISCNGDGDEVVHFIEVSGLQGYFPTPTPSNTPTRTPTYTATPSVTPTASNTPTSTPTATPVSLSLAAAADAHILQSAPTTNLGDSTSLSISATGDRRALLFFDVSQVPVGAGALQARLRLRSQDPAGDGIAVLAYGLRRAWQEGEVTWERASAAQAWAQPGADDAELDRDQAASASTVVSGGATWYEWDVTEIVNAWTKGLVPNTGLLLMAMEESGGVFSFSSSEGSDPPQLLFSYTLATPTASPTPTRTPTRTATPGPTNTSTPTGAPTPTVVPGALVFAPTADTYISDWYPNTNYCRSSKLTVRQGDVIASLLYFDLSSIPPDTTIHSAFLSLYSIDRSNTGEMNAVAYKVRHPWVECEATWTKASAVDAWTVAGCNGQGTDRDQLNSGGLYLNSINSWWTMNVTQLVRDWVNDPASNHGMVFKGYGNVSVEYSFASSDHANPSFGPRLVISAGPLPPTDTPTITLTPPPSATPSPSLTPSITPSPTTTFTPSTTPTPSPTSSVTPSPTVGPSPTPTNTLEPSRTPTPAPTNTPQPTRVAAATPTPPPGAVRFEALADTTLNLWGPSENLGDAPQLLLRQPDVRTALLAFDTSGIASGTYIYKATLNVYVASRTNTGHLFASAYRIKRAWLEDEATWNRARIGVDWQLGGCNGGADRDLTAASTEILDLEDAWFDLDITAIVQQWVNDPASNYGIALRAVSTALVEYELGSREAEDVNIRPHIYVLYGSEPPTPVPPTPTNTPPNYPVPPTETATPLPSATPTITAGPSPTATATYLPTPTPGVGAMVIPIGRDTYLNEWNLDKNYGAAPELIVRKEGIKTALLYIPVDALPADEYILSAKLHMYVTERSNVGILFASVHKVLREWSETLSNWVLATTGSEWQQSGCKKVGVDRSGVAIDEIELNAANTWVTFDITTAVRHWVADPTSNHGLVIASDGTVYVEYFFASREHSWPSLRPWVEVLHSKTSPVPTATPTVTLRPTSTLTPSPVPTATPRSLPTPLPGQINILSGSDTILNAWIPTENTGTKSSLQVRQGNIKSTLMRFNLEDLPPDMALAQARLRLYVTESSNIHDLTLKVYRVRRDWRERETTWHLAATGVPWSVSGCDGTNGQLDRDDVALVQAAIPSPGSWFEIDLTSLVADWLAHPDENYGILLKGEGPISVQYEFGSFENENTALRPVLVVVPASPQATPTPVLQTTPTPAGGWQSFCGGADASINAWFPQAKCGHAPYLRLRSNDVMASLIHFDLSGLPAQSQVHQAQLQLYVLGRSTTAPLDVSIYRVVRPWNASEASWERATTLVRWATLGCNASSDRALNPTAGLTLNNAEGWVSVDITSLVDYWTQHPNENYGIVLKTSSGTPVSYDLASFDHLSASARPRLVVNFTSAPPTPTPTPVQTIITVVVNTDADTSLNSWSPTTTYGSAAYLPLYNQQGQKRPVFHFALDILPDNAVVTQATFKALTLEDVAYNLNVQAVGLLRPWAEYQATWNLARTGVPWTSPGADGAGTDRLTAPASTTTLLGQSRWWQWDVTALVQGWASGTLANNGLMLVSPDVNVWQGTSLASRERGQPAQLTISYFVGAPTPTVLALRQGHNMVSFPLLPENPSLEAVLAPIADLVLGVWAYDSADAASPWKVYVPGSPVNSLTTIDPRWGYWIEVSQDATLPLQGSVPGPQTIALHSGWNLIGFPCQSERGIAQALASIADHVTIAWHFDAADPIDPWNRYVPGAPAWTITLDKLAPTRGYWIMVDRNCSLVLP